ncbi:WD40/YVTN/BNR-like repeat-containing protein [Bizionia sediminis]|uniref:WD40/YVTN/BNR-like repeat-containing protein n=1 Tax=Bizionia sediminis TaxID=1737064 RepID=A0ABW5KPT4_9FLAO
MKHIFFIALLLFVWACKPDKMAPISPITGVAIEPILTDSTLSIRALDILDTKNIAFAANNNTYGLYNTTANTWLLTEQQYDSLTLEFRAVGNNLEDFFMLSVGNPALLFKTTNSGTMALVYKEAGAGVFYNAMAFWNKQEGIAVGDATDSCMSVIITRDGGNTWKKLSCKILPDTDYGAAAFAASNTNIVVLGSHTWIATGGVASAILYSPDKGKTWEAYKTPIVQGTATTGMYSLTFYDAKTGFAIGGDYTNPDAYAANKIRTLDGGKTWELVAAQAEPGYRSCVQYIPNSGGTELLAVGFNGMDYSSDNGLSWKRLSDAGYYTIRFLNDSVAFAAGKGRISKLTFKR